MSASILHQPAPSYEWLPMPIDITDDHFARDLLQLFDKKQLRLRHEMAELKNHNSTCCQPQDSLEEGQNHQIQQLSSILTYNVDNGKEKNEGEDEQQEDFENAIPPPIKIAINTIISIPPHPPARHTDIRPPSSTHWPPRPLKYAPVKPLENEPRKNALHRISFPVLTRTIFHPEERRFSDSTKDSSWSLFRPSKKSKRKEQAGSRRP